MHAEKEICGKCGVESKQENDPCSPYGEDFDKVQAISLKRDPIEKAD